MATPDGVISLADVVQNNASPKKRIQDEDGTISLAGLLSTEQAETNDSIKEDRGFGGDVVSHVLRGGVQAVKGVGGLMRMSDADPEKDEGFVASTGKKLTEWADKAPSEYDILKPDAGEAKEGFVKRGVMGGFESAAPSVLPLGGAVVGAKVGGTIGGLVGGPPGAIIGGLVGGVGGGYATLFGTFGLGQYQNTYDETKKILINKGVSEPEAQEKANTHALKDAFWETVGELSGDAASMFFFGALFKPAIKQGVKQTVRQLVSGGGAKEFAKAYFKSAPFEVGSEMGTAYGQTKSANEVGISDVPVEDAMAEAVIPAVVLSLVFGSSIRGMQAVEAHNIYKNLNSKDPKERINAAQAVSARMEDAESQKAWRHTVLQHINAGQEIPLSKPIVDFASQAPDPADAPIDVQDVQTPETPVPAALTSNLSPAEQKKAVIDGFWADLNAPKGMTIAEAMEAKRTILKHAPHLEDDINKLIIEAEGNGLFVAERQEAPIAETGTANLSGAEPIVQPGATSQEAAGTQEGQGITEVKTPETTDRGVTGLFFEKDKPVKTLTLAERGEDGKPQRPLTYDEYVESLQTAQSRSARILESTPDDPMLLARRAGIEAKLGNMEDAKANLSAAKNFSKELYSGRGAAEIKEAEGIIALAGQAKTAKVPVVAPPSESTKLPAPLSQTDAATVGNADDAKIGGSFYEAEAKKYGVNFNGIQKGHKNIPDKPMFTADIDGVQTTFTLEKDETLPQAIERKRLQKTEYEAREPIAVKSGVSPVTEVPLNRIKLSKDVPQFKGDANEKGVVQALHGKEYRRVPMNAVILWERKNGDLELITGRHRLDLAQRLGEKTIPSQVVKESEGFTAQGALTFDAEQNIIDNQGTEKDYANYFRNTNISEDEARSRGLLRGTKASSAWILGKNSTDQTFNAYFRTGEVTFRQAVAVSKAAPNDERLQLAGRSFVTKNPRSTDSEVENFVHALSLVKDVPKQVQGDLFGFDDSAIRTAEMQAKKAAAIIGRLRRDSSNINAAIRGEGKLELSAEGAKEYGIKNQKDKEQLKAARNKILSKIGEWEKWYVNPDLVRQLTEEKADVPSGQTVTGPPKEAVPAKTKKEPVNVEKDQAEIPGASAAETFDLTNPETEISKPLPQQVTPKNEDLFGKPAAGSEYGSKNKIFTEDKAEKARAILKAKLNGTQLNAGIDPEILTAGIDLAGYHIEAGARKFVDFSTKMVADIGDTIKPYLKSLYLAVRNYPGIDNKGMNTEAELDRIITATTKLTYDQFVEQYKEAFKQGNKYKPNEVGFSHYADEMARLADDYPEFLDRFEAEEEEKAYGKKATDVGPYGKVADAIAEKLKYNTKFTRNELFAMCSEAFGGTLAEGKFSAKDAYDAMEMGINKYIYDGMLNLPQGQKEAENVVGSLKKLFDLIPTQTTRTAEMDEFQQFSTPPALAFAANWVANLNENDVYMEPSAGTGNNAVFAKIAGVKETIVNELAPRRAAILKEMGFDQVFTENAEQINNILPKEIKPTVVVMNPPFSSTAGRMQGERKTSNATVHIEQALKRLVPGGRLVAIVGEGMAADRPTFKPWFNKLANEYIVRANIGISGQEYVKYGTSFGNQILVIDKPLTPKSIDNTDKKGIIELTGRVDKIEQLIDLLEGVRNERINLGEQRPAEQGEQESPGGTQTGTGRNESLQPATGEMVPRTPAGRSGRQTDRNDNGNDAGVGTVQGNEVTDDRSQQRGKGGTRALGEGKEQSGGTGRSDSSVDQRSTDVALSGRIPEESAAENLTVEQKADIEKRVDEPISDAIFDAYKPAKLKIPNSQPHPARLVESSAMASIEPIDPTYSPKLPEKAVKNGNISIAQLEPVVYAGQAHQEILPNGNRKGYFIGDGTGVGKGRIISAILWDNWNHGRTKAVWLSQNSPLIKDAERDISGIGWDKKLLFDIGKVKFHDTIKPTQGIGFMGYGTLSRKTVVNGVTTSRLDQLVNWLGADFDGVIAFDEAHNMGNAFPIRGARGTSQPSQAALAGIELQRRLPNARIIYVSATGATEVMNLAYAERLGLWGDKTAFPTALNFIQDISAGGITSMEMVAMNMKANGVYLARSLACDDVKYERLEHPLTTEQRKIYDELAQAWQITMRNIEAALTATGVTDDEGHTKNKHAKSHILSAYWGTNQRFWNQIITSMQMPTVIKTMESDIKKGNAVVVQLVNTNEAAQGRALARMEEEDNLEDLDITPREMLIEYVNNSFPIHQFEDYMDEDGNVASRPVVDSAGNPVINQEAVNMRDDLLMKLASIRVPDGPLEIILDHFGTDVVAEVTGRSRRVVYKNTPEGKRRVTEPWGKNKGMADADAFMNDKKQILVFSKAGGTGRSYHADNQAKNKRLRRHYLIQAGWQANAAVQGLGRTHRSNQAQSPEWILVTTDLNGQKRFISSIARRLNQLGALTKGQRETGSQGLFSSRDNLESTEASEALIQLITDIFHGEVADLSMADFIRVTGLDRMIDPKTNGLNAQGMPHITQFLNRILNMEIEIQNLVFNEFSRRLDMKVAQAIEQGTLDTGVETIRAKKTEKINEQVVYTDEKTKAQAKYVEVRLTHDAKLVDFAKSRTMVKNGYVQNIKSGRIWALAGDRSITDINGNVTPGYVAIGANYNYHNIPIEDINNAEKYVKLSDKDAELVWNDEYNTIPKEVTERIHLVTGTILPIWDRLPRDNARVYRLQVDGKNIIGRVIPRNDLAETLTALGATQSKINYKPENVFGNVLHHGYSYKLANRWRIERRKVAGDNRIEIKGADYSSLNELKKYGVFTERIAYEARYFIPTDQDTGINAIKNIIESRPIVEETIPHGAKASDVTTEDVSFGHDTNQLYSGLDITQTLNVLRGLRDNIKEATPHIEAIGRKMWEDGKRNYDSWFLGMKKFLGDLWRSFKPIMRAVWNKLKDERGSISFEKKDSEPKTAKSEKQSTLQPIREPQDPPVSKDPKVLNLYLKDETDALVKTIMNKLHPKNLNWLETMLKSPEWFGHQQISNIVRLFMRDRNEIYHETFNDLNLADDIDAPEDTVVEAAKALKNKGLTLTERIAGKVSAEYKRLQEIIDEGDTTWKRDTSQPLDEQIKKFEEHIRGKGATEETIRVWKLYRMSYDKALDLQTAQLRRMISDIIEEANFRGETPDLSELKKTLKGALAQMEEWRGFYAPRLREVGGWKVQAYKEHGPLTENREWYRDHRGSEYSAQRLANKLKREGWTIYDVGEVERIPETIYQDVKAVATAKLIDAALEKLSKKSNLTNDLTVKFNEEVLREVSDAIKARGFRSTMIHRGKGAVIRGFIEDPIRRHLQYINNLSGGIAKARVARLAMEQLTGTKFKGKQVGGIDPVKEPKAYEVAQNYITEQLRNMEAGDRIIGIAKSIATFKFLGFNVRSLAVNMTAIMTTAPAAIHEYAMGGKGSMFRVMKEIGRAGKDYGAVMAGRKLANANEQAFIDLEHKKGWDDAQYTRDALGEVSKTHSRIWSSMMDGSMYLFGKSERWNRGTTMLAAYRLAIRNGFSPTEAAEKAKDASDKAHGVYGKSTMPMWAQGTNPAAKIGQMMYVYSKFGHNYLQMLYDLGFKRHNIKAAMFAFLSPLVLAGGTALPFKDTIFAFAGVILRSLFGEDKDPEKWVWDIIRQHLGEDAERIGRHGLTGAAGVDISGSLSIGVGIPKNMIELTGAIGGVAVELKEAVENIGRGRYVKAVEHILPSGLANPVRAIRESNEGVSTRSNRRVWDTSGKPYQPSVGETISRAAGFRSTRQAVVSERTWEGHREQARYNDARNAIYEQYRAWLLGGRDPEEHKAITKKVREYNNGIKEVDGVSRITFESLRRQAKGLKKPTKKERAILQ